MSRSWGWVLGVTGFLACPCHLPFTLPLILGVLGGTGVGSYVGANTGLIYGIFTAYFIVGIGVAIYLLNRRTVVQREVCELPAKGKVPRKRVKGLIGEQQRPRVP